MNTHDLTRLAYHAADGRHVVKLIHRSGVRATSDPHDHVTDAYDEALARLEDLLTDGAA